MWCVNFKDVKEYMLKFYGRVIDWIKYYLNMVFGIFFKIILFVCFDIYNFKNEKEISFLCKYLKYYLNRIFFDVLCWFVINIFIIVIFYMCNCFVVKFDMRKNVEYKVWSCWD